MLKMNIDPTSLLFFIVLFYIHCVRQIAICKGFKTKDAINVINGYRKLHLGTGYALKEDGKLTTKALSSVQNAVLNRGFVDDMDAGQNIYQVCATFGVKITAKQVIKAWYDEVCSNTVNFKNFNFENAESFTQLVWKATDRVGIAMSTGKKDNQTCNYISAFFRPPGNIDDFYNENVSLGKLKRKEYCDNAKRSEIQNKEDSLKSANEQMEKTEHITKRDVMTTNPNFLGDLSDLPFMHDSSDILFDKRQHLNAVPYTQLNMKQSNIQKHSIKTTEPQATNKVMLFRTVIGNKKQEIQSTENELNRLAQSIIKTSVFPKINSGSVNFEDARKATIGGKNGSTATLMSKQDGQSILKIADFAKDALELHNIARSIHNSNPLFISADLQEKAQQYADNAARDGVLLPSNGQEGENLAMKCSSTGAEMTVREAITQWYSEACKNNYDFSSDTTGDAGHFTELVWKDSKEAGFGKSSSRNKDGLLCTYFVARYRPAGNFINKVSDNVKQGDFTISMCSNLNKGFSDARNKMKLKITSNSSDKANSDMKGSKEHKGISNTTSRKNAKKIGKDQKVVSQSKSTEKQDSQMKSQSETRKYGTDTTTNLTENQTYLNLFEDIKTQNVDVSDSNIKTSQSKTINNNKSKKRNSKINILNRKTSEPFLISEDLKQKQSSTSSTRGDHTLRETFANKTTTDKNINSETKLRIENNEGNSSNNNEFEYTDDISSKTNEALQATSRITKEERRRTGPYVTDAENEIGVLKIDIGGPRLRVKKLYVNRTVHSTVNKDCIHESCNSTTKCENGKCRPFPMCGVSHCNKDIIADVRTVRTLKIKHNNLLSQRLNLLKRNYITRVKNFEENT